MKSDVKNYSQKLKDFFMEQFLHDESFLDDIQKQLKKTGCHGEMGHVEESRLSDEQSYLRTEFPVLINHLREKNMLPCIVFCFNRSYCVGLTQTTCRILNRKIEKLKDSVEYIQRKNEDMKKKEVEWRMKKIRDKMDKEATRE